MVPGGLITYAARGRGGGDQGSRLFHCVLHVKSGGGGPDTMLNLDSESPSLGGGVIGGET